MVLRKSFQFGYRVVLSFREDEQSIEDEINDINANNNTVKQDIMTCSAKETDEERFDDKMAQLEDTASLLQAQFEVENSQKPWKESRE